MPRFWTTADLRARGKSSREIRRAIDDGRLVEVRPGWHAGPDVGPELVRAVRVGGLATAHTASRAMGLWTPPDAQASAFRRPRRPESCVLHVAVPSTATHGRLRDPDDASKPFAPRADVLLRWTDGLRLATGSRTGMVDLMEVLDSLFRCEAPERALAVVDSALHRRLLRRTDLHALAARLPAHLRPVVMSADGRAESGIETITRFLLQRAGLRVQVQVLITGVGTVDLLVDGRVIVECDGREWHDDDAAFEADRNRDLASTTAH